MLLYSPVWLANAVVPFEGMLVNFYFFILLDSHHFVNVIIFNTV